MTLDELIEQKRREKAEAELDAILQKKLQVKQEEKQQRNAERVQNVIQKATETTNSFENRLPTAQEFYEKRQQEKQAQQQKEQNSVSNSNTQLQTSGSQINKSQNVQLPVSNIRNTNKSNLPTFTGVAPSNIKTNPVQRDTFINFGAFYDGYQFGDLTKTVLGSVGDIAYNVVKGAQSLSEGIADKVDYGIANIAEKTGHKDFADRLRKQAQKNLPEETFRPMRENLDKNSVIGEKLDNVASGVGNSIITAGLSAVPGGKFVVPTTTYLSSSGSATTSALSEGATQEEAEMYGRIAGTGETLSEYIAGGVGGIAGAKGLGITRGIGGIDDQLAKKLSDNVTSNLAKNLVKYGVKSTGEGFEEVLSGVVSAIGKKLTYKSEEELKQLLEDEKLLDQFVTGTLSSALTQAPNLVYSNTNDIDFLTGLSSKETETQQKLQEAQELINKVQNEPVNTQTQQITSQENKTVQNGNTEQINSIENNQQTLYNNNESGSERNGYNTNEQGRIESIYQQENAREQRQRGNTINTRATESFMGSQNENDAQRFYREFEQQARENELTILSNEQQQVKNYAKKIYNKDAIYYNDDITKFSGGLSKTDKTSVFFGQNAVKEFGETFLLGHEIGEDMLKHHSEVVRESYEQMKEKIQKDNSFPDLFLDYIYNINEDLRPTYIEHPELIAKELICDTLGFMQNDNEFKNNLPHKDIQDVWINKLDINLINEIKQILKKHHDDIYINKLPTAQQYYKVENNTLPVGKYTKRKDLNPTEIANLTQEQANTTPILPMRNYTRGNKESSFLSNITTEAGFLNEDLRQEMSKEDNIRYYKGITNEETLEKAYTELQNGGEQETIKWFNKDNKNTKAEDVAKGWILLKQYQDKGNYQGAVEVAKKMRDMATNAGQTVQAYNILSRLTPEGMFYYAQSELSEAYNKMVQGKSKAWIEENSSKFDLTPEETELIKEKMESIQEVEDERTKKITLGEIQKIISDKIPPTASQSVKAWMRISMLFNPKTQVRNVMGNAVILPVNMTSDFVSSGIDKIIAKKTGVRTTGNTNIKSYAKGFGKGLYESYDDFRKGINTRNIEGNRFEVSEGKNFKDKGLGKALNKVDNILSFMLDAGDRGFYEATFTNSINNQLVLNNTTEVTQDMIDIATNEALQRTWQDNNAYTSSVLKIRKILNFGKGYGLGDVLIPFAKTPANLTKAIVDYSPVGLTKTLAIDARKFKNSLENGQYTPQLQHQFVQNLGKGMAGSFLYVLGYALAKAGIATGEADDDKDVKNFMKNSLGISSYSIKIGDKTFSYDWAQPVATPLAIMTNYVKYSKDNPDANALEKIWKSMNIGTEQLLKQSFMESLNTVLNGSGTTLENLSQAVLELPARAIPTFSKQIADMVDGTQRTSFEYGKPIESAINSVKAKIPGLSQTLAPVIDTLGNEVQKYGGNNGIWNVMFNPANTNRGQLSKAGKEIYNVYMQTGDTTIFPRTAPYYIDSKGEKINMNASQRSEFQKVTGKYVENTLNGLLNNSDYKKLSDEKKADIINQIVSDSYSKAKYDILKIDSEEYQKLRNTLSTVSTTSYYNYKFKTKNMKKDSEKINVIINANYSNKEKQTLYENYIKSKDDIKYEIIKSTGLNINNYLKYKLADTNDEFTSNKKDDGTVKGKTISGSAKNKRYNYINSMNATYTQKLILFALEYEPSSKTDKQQIISYVATLKGKTNKEKLDIMSKFKGVTVYKDGTFDY